MPILPCDAKGRLLGNGFSLSYRHTWIGRGTKITKWTCCFTVQSHQWLQLTPGQSHSVVHRCCC